MTNRAIDPVSPKFLKASSLDILEREMRKMILRSRKQYDFYFFQEVKGGFVAWYREEINLGQSLNDLASQKKEEK